MTIFFEFMSSVNTSVMKY